MMEWQYSPQGLSIHVHEVWTSVIDILTTIASHDRDRTCDSVTGYSVDNTAVLTITRKVGQRRLTYARVAGAMLVAVYGVSFREQRFAEMDFRFFHAGVEIGIGALFRPRARPVLLAS